MYDVTSTNGHSEDYYQVPLKKNLKLEKKKKYKHNIQHKRRECSSTKRKKSWRKKRPVEAESFRDVHDFPKQEMVAWSENNYAATARVVSAYTEQHLKEPIERLFCNR